jgi:hypothetical protein
MKLKFHCHVRKSPLLVPNLSRVNPVRTTLAYLSKIHLNTILPTNVWVFLVVSFLLILTPISIFSFVYDYFKYHEHIRSILNFPQFF